MSFNLIDSQWIPVRTRSGGQERIAPWELTRGDPPGSGFLEIDFPRPDFNAAVMQFLIGVAQTALRPQARRDLRQLESNPPSPESLREKFSAYAHAFNLDGDGPRFMQDFDPDLGAGKGASGIAALLIDSAGEQTLTRNTDFFIKRDRVSQLCPECAAAALITMQASAPAGGAGIRTSLRGGGPLTTLVLGVTLWATIVNNLLTATDLSECRCDADQPEAGGVFPWLAPTRTSAKGEEVHPGDVHPLHMYWSMPRRIRLLFDDEPATVCDLCGRNADGIVKEFIQVPRGYNYKGAWMHPLTPYRFAKGEPFSIKGAAGVLNYRNWIGLIEELPGENGAIPALCLRAYRKRVTSTDQAEFRVWGSGYDMDNMKARAWCEGVMPVWIITDEAAAARQTLEIPCLVAAAREAALVLRGRIKEALFGDDRETKFDGTIFTNAEAMFWAESEPDFHLVLHELGEAMLARAAEPALLELKLRWLRCLRLRAVDIYKRLVMSAAFDPNNPKRVADALRKLGIFVSRSNPRVRKALNLPEPPKVVGKKPRKGKAKE